MAKCNQLTSPRFKGLRLTYLLADLYFTGILLLSFFLLLYAAYLRAIFNFIVCFIFNGWSRQLMKVGIIIIIIIIIIYLFIMYQLSRVLWL